MLARRAFGNTIGNLSPFALKSWADGMPEAFLLWVAENSAVRRQCSRCYMLRAEFWAGLSDIAVANWQRLENPRG